MKTSGAHGGVAARALTLGPVRQRIAPDTASSFYLIARSDRGTAFAHHFVRNLGGSDSVDTGAPYAPWRYIGTAELPAFDSSPTDAGRFVYSDDTGAQDYALQFTANGKYGGSYHGGEALTAEAVRLDGVAVDPAQAASGSQFSLFHSSTVTSGGNSYTMEFTVTVRSSDGALAFHCATSASAASFSTVFMGMVIGSGAYDEASIRLSGGSQDMALPVQVGTTYIGNAFSVRMRRTDNGRAIRTVANIPGQPNFRRTKIVRTGGRSKLYFEGTNGTLGTKVNLVWTVTFEAGATGASSFPTNLLGNGGFASDLSGWTATHNPSGIAWSAPGIMRMTRSASADGRCLQGVSTQAGAVYLLSASETSTPAASQGMASIGLTSASNGSISTPAPALSPVTNEAGYNAHVVIATQATHYAIATQALGTAGQTSDFDDFSLIKLADSI